MSESEWQSQWTCQQVLLSFMQAVDRGDADQAAALVTPSAEWHRQGEIHEGPAAIRAVILERPRGRLIRHHLTGVVVTLHTPVRATSRAYYTVYIQEPSETHRSAARSRIGDHHAEFLRTDAGWRISQLRAERLFPPEPATADR